MLSDEILWIGKSRLVPLVSSRFIAILMCACAIFLGIDTSLGRVDYSLLSDQTLMEMLIRGFDDESQKEFQDNDGMHLDVCKWSCIKCDDDERVVEIDKNNEDLSGSIEISYVPPKVKVLIITSWRTSQLSGSADFTHLPEGMEDMRLNNNELTGNIDLTHLPIEMKDLRLNKNQLTGEIDLTHLPYGVELLFLNGNQFTGEIDLTHLPERISQLTLNNNQLTGGIDLTRLPDGMRYLTLNNSQLTGSLFISNLPPLMILLDIRANLFNAIAVVDSQTHATVKLEGSGVTSAVDENGIEVAMQ